MHETLFNLLLMSLAINFNRTNEDVSLFGPNPKTYVHIHVKKHVQA